MFKTLDLQVLVAVGALFVTDFQGNKDASVLNSINMRV